VPKSSWTNRPVIVGLTQRNNRIATTSSAAIEFPALRDKLFSLQRNAMTNQIRGLVAEYGQVAPQ
jgi:hypothetical protein